MNTEQREPGQFTMHMVTDEEQQSDLVPQSVVETGSEESTPENFAPTESLSKRAKLALYSVVAFFTFVFAVKQAQTAYEFWSIHWLLGSVFIAAFGIALSLSIWAVWHWLRGKEGLEVVHELQRRAFELRSGKSSFHTHEILDQICDYYRETHLESICAEVVKKLPDYLNDQERLDWFEMKFLIPLDERVEACIQRFSLQTATAVAASPIPVVDAMLTLWRNVMMINQISAIYGVKPTLPIRLKVILKVGRAVAYSGLSQGALDLIDLSKIPYANIATKALQGFGAGMATARIGHLCAVNTRPVPIKEPQENLNKILQSLRLLFGKRVISKAEQAPIE